MKKIIYILCSILIVSTLFVVTMNIPRKSKFKFNKIDYQITNDYLFIQFKGEFNVNSNYSTAVIMTDFFYQKHIVELSIEDHAIENQIIDELVIQVDVGMIESIFNEFHESSTVELEFIIIDLETNEEYSKEVFVHELFDEQNEYKEREA